MTEVKLHNNVYLLFHCMEKVIFVPICVGDVLSKCSPLWLTIINTYSKITISRLICICNLSVTNVDQEVATGGWGSRGDVIPTIFVHE